MQEQITEKDEEIKMFEAKIALLEKEIQWKKQVRLTAAHTHNSFPLICRSSFEENF